MGEKEIAPLDAEDRDGKATYRQIVKFVRSVRRDQGRVNTLRLWAPAMYGEKCIKGIARVENSDHPSVQALLERRDRYNDLKEKCDALRQLLKSGEVGAEERIEGFQTYDRLTARMEKELTAIEQALLDLRREFATSAKTMATILVEAAKLRQHRAIHQDRMDLARNQDPSQLSTADLLRIAESETL